MEQDIEREQLDKRSRIVREWASRIIDAEKSGDDCVDLITLLGFVQRVLNDLDEVHCEPMSQNDRIIEQLQYRAVELGAKSEATDDT
jgi:hypothetical protein